MKRDKILQENELIEEPSGEEKEPKEEEEFSELEEEEAGLYPESSEEEEGAPPYIPRLKLHAYHAAEGFTLKQKKRDPQKFTKGTDPRVRDELTFMVDQNIGCP